MPLMPPQSRRRGGDAKGSEHQGAAPGRPQIGYLAFNTEHKPLDDVRVRRRSNYAINRDAILKAVYQGAGKKAKNPIPPTIWSYNDA